MTATVYQLRDYQSPKDIERMQRELEKEAAKILVPLTADILFQDGMPIARLDTCPPIPYGGAGIDGMDLGKEPA